MQLQLLKMALCFGAFVGVASAGLAQTPQEPKKQPTTAEMQTAAEEIVANATALSLAVKALIEAATKEGDMIKVTCLRDKSTQIDGHLGTAQQHLAAFRKATTADARGHEYTMIVVAGQKLETLNKEAGQCVGKDLYETGQTTVDTVIDTDMLPFENNPSIIPTILPPSLPAFQPPVSEIR